MQQQTRAFDKHLPLDVRHVAQTARVLSLKDVDLFKLAHRWFYGSEVREAVLDEVMGEYLLRQRVPPWVRHYCREVLMQACQGKLKPHDFGLDTIPASARPFMPSQIYASLVTFAAFVFYLFVLA